MSKYLDSNGLLYLWGKIKALVSAKVDKVEGKALSTNDYTTTEKNKLAGLSNYTHPTGDGNKHVPATSTTSEGKFLKAGATAGSMTWEALTKNDITALGIPGTAYTHPSHTAKASGLYKVTVDAQGHVTAASAVAKSDITGLGIPSTNTTYSAATQSANGLMSAADKTKLDGFSAASTYALKTDITGMYKYKGSKSTYANLPSSGNTNGDVWNVEADGMNYAWTGSSWDALGAIFSIESITNSEIDTVVAG